MPDPHTALIACTLSELSLGETRLAQVGLTAGERYLLHEAPAAVRATLEAQDVSEFPVLLYPPTQAVLYLLRATERELEAWPPNQSGTDQSGTDQSGVEHPTDHHSFRHPARSP